jgi:hypothetical protein
MGTERLAVEFERNADGNVLLRVTGKLERGTAALLEGVLQAGVRARSMVDHIDSRGRVVRLTAEAEAARRSVRVEVIGVRESLKAHRPPLE